jgi:hypothetical protein
VFANVLAIWQGQLSGLEGKRLAYDAEKRRLVQHATAATSTPPPAAASPVEDPALAQLAEDAAAVNSELRLLLLSVNQPSCTVSLSSGHHSVQPARNHSCMMQGPWANRY